MHDSRQIGGTMKESVVLISFECGYVLVGFGGAVLRALS